MAGKDVIIIMIAVLFKIWDIRSTVEASLLSPLKGVGYYHCNAQFSCQRYVVATNLNHSLARWKIVIRRGYKVSTSF